MQSDEKDLKNIPIFSSITDSERKEILPYITKGTHKRKEIIFSEGDPSDWFYICSSGKIKITKLSHDGREIIIEIISPPDFFGGFAVLRGFPYPANAVVMEDSEILKIARSDLLKIIDRFPAVLQDIVANLGTRMKDFHDTLKNIALEKVESRIAALLLKLADKAGQKRGSDVLIDMKLTKQDISEMVGTTVETAIRVMSRFKKDGLVSDEGGKVIIKNAETLRAKLRAYE